MRLWISSSTAITGSLAEVGFARSPTNFEATALTIGFEFVAREWLTAAGLPPDPGQRRLSTPGRARSIDLPYTAEGVGVECIGFA
jgi:hypothetical protein